MKYFGLALILIGFVGLWHLSFAEINYPDALKIPFDDSDLVLVGTIISKDEISNNQTKYGIDVDNYLKNSKSFNMIPAISYGTKNQTEPYAEVPYYNEPFFDVGQKVFVYLKMNDGGEYVVSPYSFALEKNDAKGPPPSNLFSLINKTEYKSGENITISGIVKKAYLYFESLKSEDTSVSITVLNPENKQYLSDTVRIDPNGKFDYSFTPNGDLAIGGMYSYSIGTKNESWEGGFLIDMPTSNASPYKQLKSGISLDEIQCKGSLILVTKYDGSPACVKPETKIKLIERGWAVSDQIGEKEVVSLIKKQYQQFQSFPSNDLPPKIIRVEKASNGWYVIFETQGSGIPIINATCFFVDNLKTVTHIGEYKPGTGDLKMNISFKTCS